MTENKLRHALGGLALLAGIILYGYEAIPGITVVSWGLMAAGVYLITQALFAIIFTVFASSTVLYFTGQAADTLTLGVVLISGSATIYVLARRFILRIQETREDRWAHRQKDDIDD